VNDGHYMEISIITPDGARTAWDGFQSTNSRGLGGLTTTPSWQASISPGSSLRSVDEQ
jgi:hypothetical protein